MVDRTALGVSVAVLALGLGSIALGAVGMSKANETISTDVTDAAAPPSAAVPLHVTAPEPEVVDATPTDGSTTAEATTISCSNSDLGFSLAYPADWHTLSYRPKQDCRFFSSVPLDFAESARYPESEIGIHEVRAGYDDWVGAYNDPSLSILSKEELTIDGKRATRIEYEYTDDPGHGAVYLIDNDGLTLAIQVEDRLTSDFAAANEVMDQIVMTLTFQ